MLLQEARRIGLKPRPDVDCQGRREDDESALIRQLIAESLSVPEADEVTCRRYYQANHERFRSPDLFEAAHILFLASREDVPSYRKAESQATSAIAEIERDWASFDRIARTRSACTSGKNGGRLGQVLLGDTVPEFETFLVA